jgi:hypothetical protein
MACYLVRKKSNERGWSAYFREGHKSGEKAVPTEAYAGLGFNPEWTLEEARDRAKQLNKQEKFVSPKAANRVKEIVALKSAFLPPEQVEEFFQEVLERSFNKEKSNNKLLSHWKRAQVLLAELKLDPKHFYDRKDLIYKWFLKRKISYNYCRKLLRIINLWGEFVSFRRAQPYRKVPRPTGHIQQRIEEENQKSGKFRGKATPLTPTLLEARKEKLHVPGNYEWLFVSVWFGLRPEEVMLTLNPECCQITTVTRESKLIPLLRVYQPKLTSVKPEDRWKQIPCLYPEQVRALELIRQGKLKKPLVKKTLKRVFGEGFGLYSGRNNFQSMMLDRGHSLESISLWMGHQNIQTTWSKYRDRKRIGF